MINSIPYKITNALPQSKETMRIERDSEDRVTIAAYSLRRTARELAECRLFAPVRDIQPPPS